MLGSLKGDFPGSMTTQGLVEFVGKCYCLAEGLIVLV